MAEDVARMSFKEKARSAILRSGAYLPASARETLHQMVTPQALAVLTGTLAVWAASHFFGVGEIVDILMLAVGFATIGLSAGDGIREGQRFAKTVKSARTEADLDVAARHFAKAATILGLDLFQAILLHGQARGLATRNLPRIRPRFKIEEPMPTNSRGMRVSRPPTLGGIKGSTSAWCEIEIARDHPLSEQRLTLLHEIVHVRLTPKLAFLRKFRVHAKMFSYERSAFLRYIEEASAESYAQFKRNGLLPAIKALRFPLATDGWSEPYVTIAQMWHEGSVVGKIWLSDTLFWVTLSHIRRHHH